MTRCAPRFPMRRSNRLASAGQIAAVYASGRRAVASSAGCVALLAGEGEPKVAVVAGRKVGGAVERNRAKRRLRAAVDPLVARMTPGAHAVLGATSRTNEVDFQKLAGDVQMVLTKARALDA